MTNTVQETTNTSGTLNANGVNILNGTNRSVSARLVTLIIVVIMVIEVVLLLPSLAHARIEWLQQRVEAAYLVGLALESPAGEMIKPEEVEDLFATADIKGVTIEHDDMRVLIMAPTVDLSEMKVRHFVDLTYTMDIATFTSPWGVLFSNDSNLIRVSGKAKYTNDMIDILVARDALREDLGGYARNIIGLSLLIAGLTGGFVYWRLNRLIVRPIKDMIGNMTVFQKNPENPQSLIAPSIRDDELGAAERGLLALEKRLQTLLAEQERLAALGAGISKISHDLRNVLASAQLMSDRLARSEDPRVKKLSPRLISALDRAVNLSRDTLNYARMAPDALNKETVTLKNIVDNVFDDVTAGNINFINTVCEDIVIRADRIQLYRAILNLTRNAVDALTPDEQAASAPENQSPARIVIGAQKNDDKCVLTISDNGPGVPEAAQEHLFEPFKGSLKPGGSGLGIAIAHEIIKAHGGAMKLEETSPKGTVFSMTLPA